MKNLISSVIVYPKVFLISLVLVLQFSALKAQRTITSLNESAHTHSTSGKCFADHILNQQRQNNPQFMGRLNHMNEAIRNASLEGGNREQYVIPVVVHVIHQNGTENISDDQIIAGIQHLNEAFANSGNYTHADGVNTNIQFCLAAQTPTGEYTNGITRTFSPLTDLIIESQDLQLKDLIRWDPNKYLNIWLVKEITSSAMGPGVAGYAYFPTSQGQPEDGIVNEAAYFGSTYDNSKVHVHEAGHYLGLYHTFEGGCINNNCQTDGDMVCDTPPDNSTASVPCIAQPNTCSTDDDDLSNNNPFRPVALGGLGDQPDQFKNYMDYGYQACQAYFSQGQAERMIAAITTQRSILLQSIACQSPCSNPFSLSITADNTTVPIGSSISFTSNSSGATSFQWTINGGIVGTLPDLDYLFTSAGSYTVNLTANNSDPNCVRTTSLVVEVTCPAQAHFVLTTPTPYIPGDIITTNNQSINNTTNQWILDGNPVSTSVNWSQTFTTVGGHSLYLIVSNGECADTSNTRFFQIGNCNLSGVTDEWVFLKNRIKFVNGVPSAPMASPIQNDSECSSSIADIDGNLLLSSDGQNVWDRNNNLMPNGTGLLGHMSSTQTVLITPHPGNVNQYFVFTNDAIENAHSNGLRYNIVDLTLNNGNGDVLPAFKNRPLLSHGSEKLSATWHANGHDIWVGSNEMGSNTWYAFLIDNSGIHITPVVSNIGTQSQQSIGSMRFSNDGNRMAACMITPWPWRILVSDFNRETGVYSNPIELLFSDVFNQQPFGIAFSPDNSKLYVGLWQDNDLLQYDLSLTTASQIQNSKYVVDSYEYGLFGHLVLASNGKIYVNNSYTQRRLDEIRNPNGAGALCDYYQNTIPIMPELNPGSSLPNMLQGYLMAHQQTVVGPENICKGGNTYSYQISFESEQDSTVWTHTGPGTFISTNGNNTSTLISANTTGIDIIMATIYGRCGISYDTITVHTNNPELTYLPDTTYTCDSVLLNPGNGFLSYEWSNNTYESTLMANSEGLYKVTVRGQSGCMITDSTQVTLYPSLTQVNLGPDQSICTGQITVLHSTQQYGHYLWQDGSQNATFTAYGPGTYWVEVYNGCDNSVSRDTIQVTLADFQIDLNYLGEDSVCSSSLPFVLDAPAGFQSYFWGDGQSTQSINVNSIGDYTLTVVNAAGCSASDTLSVVVSSTSSVMFSNDTLSICNGTPVLLHADSQYENLWSDESTGNTLIVTEPGLYWLQSTNSVGCFAIDSIIIVTREVSLETIADTGFCAGSEVIITAISDANDFTWSTDETTSSIAINSAGEYSVIAAIEDCSVAEHFNVVVWPTPVFSLGNDIIAESGPVILAVSNTFASYQWNVPNASSNTLQVNQSGTYILTVTNNHGCSYTDSVNVSITTRVDDMASDALILFPQVYSQSHGSLIAKHNNVAVKEIMIYDATGRLASSRNHFPEILNATDFATGIYHVVIQYTTADAQQKVHTQKLLITP